MGYRIVYGRDPVDENRGKRLRLMTAAFALALVLGVRCFWPRGTELLRGFLLPGQSETAFARMAEEIRSGERVGDAVTAFCRTVIADAMETPG